ncbi:hypothetical protein [Xenorhabdus hominickii]|uniref:Uncharacterized protein n=1 Tax=Xenorhabdus hominickii TaxID=351679 RepID=A0A2G0Q5S2_XENHO|nr:hypothetical protein [Xenorhabdus hominickii]AOM39645.1 hypothetical protein A9255_02970 [Xenorhabdus hominickii]PHM54570.1 hypothetical protein Xhom_02513 [Xenorhabdus hominickii]
MDRIQWKKIAGWLAKKANKSNFAFLGYILLIVFRPEPLELWLREHYPSVSPETFAYFVTMYFISMAIVYIPSMLIKYLRKKISPRRHPA